MPELNLTESEQALYLTQIERINAVHHQVYATKLQHLTRETLKLYNLLQLAGISSTLDSTLKVEDCQRSIHLGTLNPSTLQEFYRAYPLEQTVRTATTTRIILPLPTPVGELSVSTLAIYLGKSFKRATTESTYLAILTLHTAPPMFSTLAVQLLRKFKFKTSSTPELWSLDLVTPKQLKTMLQDWEPYFISEVIQADKTETIAYYNFEGTLGKLTLTLGKKVSGYLLLL